MVEKKEGKKEEQKEGKKEEQKEGKKEQQKEEQKEGKIEEQKEGKKEQQKEGKKVEKNVEKKEEKLIDVCIKIYHIMEISHKHILRSFTQHLEAFFTMCHSFRLYVFPTAFFSYSNRFRFFL